MNYDQRIAILKQWFKNDIATRFNMPRDLEPTIVAMDIIESVNRNIPSKINQEQMSSLVALTAKEVTQSAKTRTVPSVKEFIDAIRNASKSHGEASTEPRSNALDPYVLNAKRIRSGKPVSELYLEGPHKKKLIEEQHLTEEDFAKYQLAPTAHKQ